MIWRLEAMTESGVEGTVLGTLVMPYCSGMGNLIFAFVLGAKGGPGAEVVTNSLVNNVTNMTLLIGLPTIFWGMNLLPGAKAKKKKPDNKENQINRLSLLLTLTAVLFFTGAVWALARKGRLDAGDGLVLVGLFLFWQCFHVFDVLKSNVRQNKSFSWMLPFDLAVLAIGIYALYRPMQVPPFFQTGIIILMGAAVVHFLFVAIFGRLPRFMGWVLTAAYVVFLAKGLGKY
mgnify:CR=1 FL=1